MFFSLLFDLNQVSSEEKKTKSDLVANAENFCNIYCDGSTIVSESFKDLMKIFILFYSQSSVR